LLWALIKNDQMTHKHVTNNRDAHKTYPDHKPHLRKTD